jgi:transposase
MRPYGHPCQLERRRRQAIALLQSGQSFRAIATKLKASLSSVVRWVQAYRRGGDSGLAAKPVPGRPSRLTPRQKAQLLQLLEQGAQRVGYTTDVWTLKRIRKLIEDEFGQRYVISGVWHLLVADLNWSAQKPERRATQRDEEAIATWKRTAWPRIKKSPKTGRVSGISR